jgi:16S rRNA (adenine1518-N6/adenine1519-N6)-dimethyltransferase
MAILMQPRKRFGQHFLSNQRIIANIVAALAPQASDHLVEIGPGQGALTVPVLKLVKHLEVIELDRDLIPELERRCLPFGELKVYAQDALQFDFRSIVRGAEKLRVFGNLPYNISTPLLFHLLAYNDVIGDMLFMLQKEVAERMVAPVNSEHYGRLSVMVQFHCRAELLFDVPPSAFYPPPQVKSSMVRLMPDDRFSRGVRDYARFAEVVRLAFNQRRKTLRNSLKHLVSDDDWAHMALHSDLRPENLRVEDFINIANTVGT